MNKEKKKSKRKAYYQRMKDNIGKLQSELAELKTDMRDMCGMNGEGKQIETVCKWKSRFTHSDRLNSIMWMGSPTKASDIDSGFYGLIPKLSDVQDYYGQNDDLYNRVMLGHFNLAVNPIIHNNPFIRAGSPTKINDEDYKGWGGFVEHANRTLPSK